MKKCSKCKQEKPKNEFVKVPSSSDGRHSSCKICTRKSNKEYFDKKKQERINYFI
jgi:hypothetical protein